LRKRADWVRGADVLEIGLGSGVILAALGELGAATLCGVDIEGAAVAAGALLLHTLGYGSKAQLRRGDMWEPVEGRRFDLITANLPHFPMEPFEIAGRLPSWSSGGDDGRYLLDRFLTGLAAHLAPGGRAVITHNAFVDVERSRAMLALDGLSLRIARTVLVCIPAEKLALMTGTVLRAEDGRSIHRYGPYAFGEMHIVEIGAAGALG
jgi:release factor glutamine methyltransferase